MSFAATNAVFAHSRSRGIARLVLHAIADRADKSGRTWCSATDIAHRAAIHRQNVPRLVASLCTLGELQVARGAGKHGTNLYTIAPALLAAVDREETPSEPALTASTPQDETPSPRDAAALTLSRECSHAKTRTILNHPEPSKEDSLPFSSLEFIDAWKTWIQHRKEKRQPLTPTAIRQQLEKLSAMGEPRALATLRHSTASGYTGLFEPPSAREKPHYLPDGSPMNDAARRLFAAKPYVSPL